MFDRIQEGRWWDFGWQLVEGCDPVSAGCDHCWSLGKEKRFRKESGVVFHEERLERPLKRKKPTSYSIWNDLFHESISFEDIRRTFSVMFDCSRHTFMILTKRPERMEQYLRWYMDDWDYKLLSNLPGNIWLGVTAENQEQADKRIPILLNIPAAKRFVSIEPMLGKMDISRYLKVINESGFEDYGGPFSGRDKLDWCICGGESGHKARPMHPDWVRSIRDQCVEANVPYFFKQWGVGCGSL